MSLFIASINSGSNGNCYYVGNEHEAVLVDVGISCRETERRMARLNLSLKNVKAIFISHEHSDHISGVRVLSKKYNVPVYITQRTFLHSGLDLHPELVRFFEAEESVSIGNLLVHTFSKKHDAADPTSFMISGNGVNIGVLTDIGNVCANVTAYFKHCHAAFLEANYDEEMLENGRYPWMLKNRIRSGRGHLSNKQALDLFINHKPTHMSHVFLSHLSADNNHPDLAHELFTNHAGNTQVVVAPRTGETPVYRIEATENRSSVFIKAEQLSLFGN